MAIRRSWGRRREVSAFVVVLETGDQVPILSVWHEQYLGSQMAPAAGNGMSGGSAQGQQR